MKFAQFALDCPKSNCGTINLCYVVVDLVISNSPGSVQGGKGRCEVALGMGNSASIIPGDNGKAGAPKEDTDRVPCQSLRQNSDAPEKDGTSRAQDDATTRSSTTKSLIHATALICPSHIQDQARVNGQGMEDDTSVALKSATEGMDAMVGGKAQATDLPRKSGDLSMSSKPGTTTTFVVDSEPTKHGGCRKEGHVSKLESFNDGDRLVSAAPGPEPVSNKGGKTFSPRRERAGQPTTEEGLKSRRRRNSVYGSASGPVSVSSSVNATAHVKNDGGDDDDDDGSCSGHEPDGAGLRFAKNDAKGRADSPVLSHRKSQLGGEKLPLLLEFIPYFGTGDMVRDSMVRSILGSADPEELAGNCDEYGNTLLILACQHRCRGLVPLILARGEHATDVNAVNSAGACALHFACYKDSICVESAILLLEHGAKPEMVENTYGYAD